MKENGQNYEDDIEITDEEQYTDKKIKSRLLNTRELVIKMNNRLNTERLVEPDVEYSAYEARAAWAKTVQSYLYELAVLLNHDDIPQSEYYREQVDIGKIQLVPEDTAGIPFSKIVYDSVDEEDIIYQSNRLQRGAELPKPTTKKFKGLMSVAETDFIVSHSWVVLTNPREAPPNHNRITVQTQEPVPEDIFQKALVESDQFLMNAGIGIDIEAADYMADGEPGL